MPIKIQFLDESRRVVATALVDKKDDYYSGHVDLKDMPIALRAMFDAYEDVVNDQTLSLLDEIEDRISAQRIVAQFGDGSEVFVNDLQIYPKAGMISFKTVQEPVQHLSRS